MFWIINYSSVWSIKFCYLFRSRLCGQSLKFVLTPGGLLGVFFPGFLTKLAGNGLACSHRATSLLFTAYHLNLHCSECILLLELLSILFQIHLIPSGRALELSVFTDCLCSRGNIWATALELGDGVTLLLLQAGCWAEPVAPVFLLSLSPLGICTLWLSWHRMTGVSSFTACCAWVELLCCEWELGGGRELFTTWLTCQEFSLWIHSWGGWEVVVACPSWWDSISFFILFFLWSLTHCALWGWGVEVGSEPWLKCHRLLLNFYRFSCINVPSFVVYL